MTNKFLYLSLKSNYFFYGFSNPLGCVFGEQVCRIDAKSLCWSLSQRFSRKDSVAHSVIPMSGLWLGGGVCVWGVWGRPCRCRDELFQCMVPFGCKDVCSVFSTARHGFYSKLMLFKVHGVALGVIQALRARIPPGRDHFRRSASVESLSR